MNRILIVCTLASIVSARASNLDLQNGHRRHNLVEQEEVLETHYEAPYKAPYKAPYEAPALPYESPYEAPYEPLLATQNTKKTQLNNKDSVKLMIKSVNRAPKAVLTSEVRIVDEGSFLSHNSYVDEIGFDKWNRNTLKVLKLTLENQDPELAEKYGLFSQLSTDPVSELNTNPVFDDLIVDSPKIQNRSKNWFAGAGTEQKYTRFMGFEISETTVRLLKVAGAIVIAFSVFRLLVSSLRAYRSYQALKIRNITNDLNLNPGTARPDLMVMEI